MKPSLLADAIALCLAVGKRLEDMQCGVDIQKKGANDLITAADREAEKILIKGLKSLLKGANILSEEVGNVCGDRENPFTWVIDPLDGTVNYATHVPFYAISVALLENGSPILGVVHSPVTRETFSALKGDGAYFNGQKFSTQRAEENILKTVAVSTGLMKSDFVEGNSQYFTKLSSHFQRVKLMGSQALHLCYVAAGRFDAALSNIACLWDDAAGALIVQEAGGSYTSLSGEAIFPLPADSDLYTGKPFASLATANLKIRDMVVKALH